MNLSELLKFTGLQTRKHYNNTSNVISADLISDHNTFD